MIRLLLAALAIAMPIAAMAADKGGPPLVIDKSGEVVAYSASNFAGCYVDAGGQVWVSEGASRAVGFGGGCDRSTGRWLVGGRIQYAFGEADVRALSLSPRIGFAINPHTLAYAKFNYTIDGHKFQFSNGVVSAGVGLEAFVAPNVTIYIEGTQSLKGYGDASDVGSRLYNIGAGLRWRF